MSSSRFQFASGNVSKLLALPKYLLSVVLSIFVPRRLDWWAFGSGIGVGEGALAVAQQLRHDDPDARIVWLVANEVEAAAAEAHSFEPVMRTGWRGYWATLRAGNLVVTHGLGDVNRFGVFGGTITQLWHGAPLKRIHLDSQVTTAVSGPAPVRALLRRMYSRGTNQVDLYVAGSIDAAERLRSAFRVDPGKVQVLGDPRDDALARQSTSPALARAARDEVVRLLGAEHTGSQETLVLYAPTWRDGSADAAVPSEAEVKGLHAALESISAHLVIRSHPLGAGSYEHVRGERVHLLGSDLVRDVTPLLGAFDTVITDYSSIAVDYALIHRPIVWFAPDLDAYVGTRGLYEPLEVTAGGAIERSWGGVVDQLRALHGDTDGRRTAVYSEAVRASRQLASRFHAHTDGVSAGRVLAAIAELQRPARDLVPNRAAFFESFYGRQVSCNPLAIDREIAIVHPEVARFWSVTSERQEVPEGAIPVLVGGREWFAARQHAQLLVVNDWLRYGFRRAKHQVVLQTWHGTMLKHLALGRPNVSLRTRLAIRRESSRWSLLLSQNPHSTEQFTQSYAYDGEILEAGYPRDDRLARAVLEQGRNPIAVSSARAALSVPEGKSVLVYAPTWRDRGVTVVDDLDVNALAEELGDDWVVVARGHTRTHMFGGYRLGDGRVIDASRHADVNDVILAADMFVTDYSSLMFDAAVAKVPLAFFVPDIAAYRDCERGFTFDFEREAPGPLLADRDEVVSLARELHASGDLADTTAPMQAQWIREAAPAYAAWRERFTPHDDGHAAERVVERLEQLGAFRG